VTYPLFEWWKSLHANWWNVPSCDESIFFCGGGGGFKIQKEKKAHTHSAGECFTNMDKLSIRHMKHIFLSLLTKLI